MGSITALWIVALATVGPVAEAGSPARPADAAARAAGAAARPAGAAARPAGVKIVDPVIEHCLVSMIDEAQVPGRQPGVLVALEAKEGMQVKAGSIVGRIDDSEPTSEKRIKTKEYETAKEQATNDVNVRYAKEATKVSKVTYESNHEANQHLPGSIPRNELLKFFLEWKKAELQIEQADHEQKVAVLTADAKLAAVDAADLGIRQRQITSPIDGIVVKIYKHVGEWVAPGDPVVRIVRVDRLRIEAFLNASDYLPQELDAKAVTVEVELARGRIEKFPGKVVFVSPLVEAGGEYRVLADVVNRIEDGQWLLRPGQLATMTIHLQH